MDDLEDIYVKITETLPLLLEYTTEEGLIKAN